MDDDPRAVDRGWDALPDYTEQAGDADEAVTVSISTTPGEWLVNTTDAVVVPMSMAEVVDALRQRKLTERSLVWRAGMQEWAPIDKVPQLKLAARMAPGLAPSSSPAPKANGTPPSSAPLKPNGHASVLAHAPPKPSANGHASVIAPAPSKPSASTTPLGPPPAVATHAIAPVAEKPSKPPVKSTPAPRSTTPAPQVLPSRRSTLPFGLATPPSRPSNPIAAPRPAIPPADGEDTEVLAVYARPAATISFDLAPVAPERTAAPHSAPAPQTLAPLTTDSSPRSAPPRSADLSVVAASHFRDTQRSSKRLIVVCSVASAAAASLLTFLLSHRAPEPAAARAPEPAATLPVAAPVAKPTPPPEVAPSAAPEPPPVVSAAKQEPAPKPKARRAKTRVAPAPRPVEAAPDSGPAAEPNPYDVKLDDDVTPTAKPTTTHGSGLDDDSKSSDAGNTLPGF